MPKPPQTEFHKVFLAELQRDVLIVAPKGDAVGFRDLDIQSEISTLEALVKQPEVQHLVVDLGYAKYFGSIVIGAFNSLGLQVRDKGGRIALCNVSDDMLGVLRIMKLDQLWPHFDNLKLALKYVTS